MNGSTKGRLAAGGSPAGPAGTGLLLAGLLLACLLSAWLLRAGDASAVAPAGDDSRSAPLAASPATPAAAPARAPAGAASGPDAPAVETSARRAAASQPRDPPRPATPPFDPRLAGGLEVRFGDEVVPYEVLAVFALPGERVPIRAEVAGGPPKSVSATATAGELSPAEPGRWTWTAPEDPGLVPLDVAAGPGRRVRLNVFVMTPATRVENGYLNGYRVGRYPAEPLRGLAAYEPPRGFVRVTPENRDTPVSPHFTLGQFVCKQAGGWPRYVALQSSVLVKLERVLAGLAAALPAGAPPLEGLFVMSAFRTPYYNRLVRSNENSRHTWGDAADVFVDRAPLDGVMDDLDGDGAVTTADAVALAAVAEALAQRPGWTPGGLGIYPPNPARGPFVHLDVRGYAARWGP